MGAWGVIANQAGTRRVSALFDQALALAQAQVQADADSAALAALVSNLRLERGASHPA
jgi:thioredoxin-like negative regulator of GroEL